MSELSRIRISVPEDQADILTAFLAVTVAQGWEEQPIVEGMTATLHMTHKEAANELVRVLQERFPMGMVVQDSVEEQNWAEAWKEFFTPVKGGEHFYILAPWMEEELRSTDLIPILIEPKTAFGTGHHGTTSLCLDTISSLFTDKKICSGMRFLDLGTGSGILGIACAKLGLHGEGLDIDSTAIANALENRQLNAVSEESFSVYRGGVEVATGYYDLVLANILAEPLKEMAAQITQLFSKNPDNSEKKSSILVLSGMLDHQTDAVEAVYCSLGLSKAKKIVKGEWAALIFFI